MSSVSNVGYISRRYKFLPTQGKCFLTFGGLLRCSIHNLRPDIDGKVEITCEDAHLGGCGRDYHVRVRRCRLFVKIMTIDYLNRAALFRS